MVWRALTRPTSEHSNMSNRDTREAQGLKEKT
jgi:hypothetical protein